MQRFWIAIALGVCVAIVSNAALAADPTTFAGGKAAVEATRKQSGRTGRAKNVILFLGDGMGVSTITAARIFEGQRRGETGEENLLAFEVFPYTALVKTYNVDQQTPDSAGTMTALVTGEKTNAGVLSVNRSVHRGDYAAVSGNELRTIAERAEERGLSTGIVTTTTVTHATPAALYAHAPDRSWVTDSRLPTKAVRDGFADIARQLVEFPYGDGIDVVLGGGRNDFRGPEFADPVVAGEVGRRRDGRDLVADWTRDRPGAAYVTSRSELLAVDTGTVGPLLGLFHPTHMSFEVDRVRDALDEPSLSEMTSVAIAALRRNPKGFFLMVEGGRIDHAHHAGNAYRALAETVEFSNAVRVALRETDPTDTLVVVTADHSHVLTLGGQAVRGNDVLGKVVPLGPHGEPSGNLALDSNGRPFTSLGYYNGPGASHASVQSLAEPMHTAEKPDLGPRGVGNGRPDLTDVDTSHPDFLQEAAVPLGYETHGGEDVVVYALGPAAQLVRGVREQNYVYHVMVEAFGWERSGPLDWLFR